MRDGVLKPTPERLDTIHAEVMHLQRLVEDLRTLSQADAGELTLNRETLAPLALLEAMDLDGLSGGDGGRGIGHRDRRRGGRYRR